MRAALRILTLTSLAAAAPAQIQNPSNGHFYEAVSSGPIAWTTARQAAETMSHMGMPGHLVTLSDAAENQWVWDNLPAVERHWLGGFQDTGSPSYSEPAGGWTWVTGEDWSFEQWNPGEPNDSGGNEDYLAFDNSPNWNDAPIDWMFNAGFIVEYEPLITVYCTAKTNSCNSLPQISGSGIPSATSGSGFDVSAANTKALRAGILIYGDVGRAAIPFLGGLLCVNPAPLRRAVPVFDSGGTPPACNGVLATDMNAFAVGALGGNPSPSLTMPGTQINCQYWGRDQVGVGALLSDGLEYFVGP